jgi:hypothetical protein
VEGGELRFQTLAREVVEGGECFADRPAGLALCREELVELLFARDECSRS